jgi:hypothetical protein
MPKKQRNAPNAPKITHPSIPQNELLLIALPIATMSVNPPMTRHQTGIGNSICQNIIIHPASSITLIDVFF